MASSLRRRRRPDQGPRSISQGYRALFLLCCKLVAVRARGRLSKGADTDDEDRQGRHSVTAVWGTPADCWKGPCQAGREQLPGTRGDRNGSRIAVWLLRRKGRDGSKRASADRAAHDSSWAEEFAPDKLGPSQFLCDRRLRHWSSAKLRLPAWKR